MVKNKTIAYRIFLVFDYILLGAFAIMCLLPVLHVAFASFSDPAWVMSNSGLILRPHGFNIDGYQQVFSNRSLMGSYGNTILYVAASTGIGLLVTVLGAYPLSKKEVLFSNALMLVISFTMLFNGGMVAFYIVVKNIGLLDSRWAVILPTCVSAFNLILVRTAMSAIPKSLEESAMLDGAGRFTILFQIMLPLIKATLATVILYYIIGNWNSWFSAMIYLRTKDKFPLQLVLKEILVTTNNSNSNIDISVLSSGDSADAVLYKQLVKYCTIVVSTVPMFIFYPFVQKYFESGVMIGAIKG